MASLLTVDVTRPNNSHVVTLSNVPAMLLKPR